jgi:hypothetical protein
VNGIFPLSQALTGLFLPARKSDMESFLANQAAAQVLLAPAPLPAPTLQDLPSEDTPVVLKAKRSG